MFGMFNKKPKGEVLKIKIDGMHCTSCSMNIDGELEDLDGVLSAKTSYPKQTSTIEFDPKKVSQIDFETVITGLGYKIQK